MGRGGDGEDEEPDGRVGPGRSVVRPAVVSAVLRQPPAEPAGKITNSAGRSLESLHAEAPGDVLRRAGLVPDMTVGPDAARAHSLLSRVAEGRRRGSTS